MKYWIFLLVIFYGTGFYERSIADEFVKFAGIDLITPQQEPIYFYYPVPPKIKILDKVDLSFFRSPLISAYRYKLEIPDIEKSKIERKLLYWSVWTRDELSEIIIPHADVEGSYKLVVEYQTRSGSGTKKFEKSFSVYRVNPAGREVASATPTQPVTERAKAETPPQTGSATASTAAKVTTSATDEKVQIVSGETIDREKLAIDSILKEKAAILEKAGDLGNLKIDLITVPEIVPDTELLTAMASETADIPEKDHSSGSEGLLTQAIEAKDSVLFRKSIGVSDDASLKGENGGNIFHLLDDRVVNEDLIEILKNKGISLNETDNFGNSPLHLAILSGKSNYASLLVNQGADLNLKNDQDLSPLHLAVFLDDELIVKDLLRKGADVNIKGNSGYTPLHIASEMNHIKIAITLLDSKASTSGKTTQALSAKSIAKIQQNPEMARLIGKKGSYTVNLTELIASRHHHYPVTDGGEYPVLDFNLPFDRKMAGNRNLYQKLQIISIPVFTLSAIGSVHFRSRANHFYSLSQTAETEELAKHYYDKTVRNDNFSYVSVGISLTSLYGFIHSTIRKNHISQKMFKTF